MPQQHRDADTIGDLSGQELVPCRHARNKSTTRLFQSIQQEWITELIRIST